jgi:hypothetical protein
LVGEAPGLPPKIFGWDAKVGTARTVVISKRNIAGKYISFQTSFDAY